MALNLVSSIPVHSGATTLTRLSSPLMLADRLITLAQEADRAGFADAATHLVQLAYDVLDDGQQH